MSFCQPGQISARFSFSRFGQFFRLTHTSQISCISCILAICQYFPVFWVIVLYNPVYWLYVTFCPSLNVKNVIMHIVLRYKFKCSFSRLRQVDIKIFSNHVGQF